jgi:ribonuclease HI
MRLSEQSELVPETFPSTLGRPSEQNPYSDVLAATSNALESLPKLRYRNIVLYTRSEAAVLTFKQPRQQSGQNHVCSAYKAIRTLLREGNTLTIVWLPSSEENELLELAIEKAKMATRRGTTPQAHLPVMRSTTLKTAQSTRGVTKSLAEGTGKHSKMIDRPLPGRPTRTPMTSCPPRKPLYLLNSGQAWPD